MQKFILGLLSIGTLTALCAHSSIEEVEGKVFYLAHPRTGNNWMRYCLNYLLNDKFHEMADLQHWEKLLKGQPYPYHRLAENPHVLWKTHFPQSLSAELSKKNKLIFVIRSHKELISRWMTLGRPKWSYGFFVLHLKTYDQWDPQNRHLYYYEDFIKHPKETLQGILDFLGASDERLDDFIVNLDKHKKASLKKYDNLFTKDVVGSASRGKSTEFHTKKVTAQRLLEMDQKMRNRAGDLFDKYLLRYEGT